MFTDQPLEYFYSDQHTPMTPQLHEDSSPALPTTPMDSLPATPNYSPSRNHILYNPNIQSNVPMESSPFMGNERPPHLYVDTSLLRPDPSSNSAYRNNQHEYNVSPRLLSPYSTGSNNPSPLREQVDTQHGLPFGRHRHSHSVEDAPLILGQNTAAPGLVRARSVPTSRQPSPYSYSGSGSGSNDNSPRSVASNKLSQGGFNFPPGSYPPSSPTDSEQIGQRRAVTTPKIRQASSVRRKYPANIQCDVPWCEDTFTTNFAKDRMSSNMISRIGNTYLTGGLTIGHMKSHSGERSHACTIPGCDKRFTTDSGRKRHERSTTLHKPS